MILLLCGWNLTFLPLCTLCIVIQKFTMELEKNGKLPVLVILRYRKQDGTVGHGIYHKPTHMDSYLNAKSLQHPAQKKAVLSTLIHHARAIADADSLQNDLQHLWSMFKGYTERQIQHALMKSDSVQSTWETVEAETKMTVLLFCWDAYLKIGRLLTMAGIQPVFGSRRKLLGSHHLKIQLDEGFWAFIKFHTAMAIFILFKLLVQLLSR